MASSSHYHYQKDNDDDDFESIFDDIFENFDLIPEPTERKKTYFYRQKPGRRSQQTLE